MSKIYFLKIQNLAFRWFSLPSLAELFSEDISKSWYEELERDIPGIDNTVIELLKTQILGLYGFLKLQNNRHENQVSDQGSPP